MRPRIDGVRQSVAYSTHLSFAMISLFVAANVRAQARPIIDGDR